MISQGWFWKGHRNVPYLAKFQKPSWEKCNRHTKSIVAETSKVQCPSGIVQEAWGLVLPCCRSARGRCYSYCLALRLMLWDLTERYTQMHFCSPSIIQVHHHCSLHNDVTRKSRHCQGGGRNLGAGALLRGSMSSPNMISTGFDWYLMQDGAQLLLLTIVGGDNNNIWQSATRGREEEAGVIGWWLMKGVEGIAVQCPAITT